MASADILRAARARIEDPKNWTTGAIARTNGGSTINATNNRACSWCAVGALFAAAKYEGCSSEFMALEAAVDRLFPEAVFIASVNDELGHDAVLQMYDAAIAAAEAEAGR